MYGYICIVVLWLLVVSAPANADPWPNYNSQTYTVNYVDVLFSTVNNLWWYYLTIDQNAVDPTFGEVIGVKGFAIYLNLGNPVSGIPSDWAGYETNYTRQGWDYNGGCKPNKAAFGYITGSPIYYVKPGETNALIGAALFPSSYTPNIETQGFLLHVAYQNDGTVNTLWVRPEGGGHAVPEPAGALALISIGGPALAAFFYRRRRSL